MSLEARSTFLGIVPLSGWGDFAGSRLGPDAEELSHMIMTKKKRIVSGIQLGYGGAVVVTILKRQESGEYHESKLTFTPDEVDQLNKIIRSGIFTAQFRNHIPTPEKHF